MSLAGLTSGISVANASRVLATSFRQAKLDSPDLDARLLIGRALALDFTGLALQADCALSGQQVETICALAARRLAHEPVARIVGSKEFWGLTLRVTPATLVPRPETETVVEAALAAIDTKGPRTRALRIADLGTGSGALLLALLSELPSATGCGTDRSFAAIEVAQDNAARLGFTARANWVVCDYGAALDGGWDLVVANPPYVPTNHIATLAPEVREFDPRAALDGGNDGLDAYRVIAADAKRLLASGASLVVELGVGQAEMVNELFAAAGLAVESIPRADLAGIPRAFWASYHP